MPSVKAVGSRCRATASTSRTRTRSTLLVVAATDYRGGDPTAACERYLARAAKPYADLRAAHVADHERLFRRVDLALARPGSDRSVEAPPDRRASGSRQERAGGPRSCRAVLPVRPVPVDGQQPPGHHGGQPPGHLERGLHPALGQQVHDQHQRRDELLAGGGRNLPETTGPLFDLVKMSLDSGRRTAKEMYNAGVSCFTTISTPGATPRRSTTDTSASGPWAGRGSPCISGNVISTGWTGRSCAVTPIPS